MCCAVLAVLLLMEFEYVASHTVSVTIVTLLSVSAIPMIVGVAAKPPVPSHHGRVELASSHSSASAPVRARTHALDVAGCQMAVTNNVTTNKQALLRCIAQAAEGGAAYMVTPEGSLSG